MNSFVNPLSRQRPTGFSARMAEIKSWTKAALLLDDDAVISVSELACSQPGCPPRQIVVLIFSDTAPARKFTVHKALLDTTEADIIDAAENVEFAQSRS